MEKIAMSPNELEVALIDKGIAQSIAKMIVVLALSPNIERHKRGLLVPVVELTGSVLSKRSQQRFTEDLRSLMGAAIVLEEGQGFVKFHVVVSVEQARDSQFILYSFSREFREWAGLPTVGEPGALH